LLVFPPLSRPSMPAYDAGNTCVSGEAGAVMEVSGGSSWATVATQPATTVQQRPPTERPSVMNSPGGAPCGSVRSGAPQTAGTSVSGNAPTTTRKPTENKLEKAEL
ncbi:hypothetical protein JOQ06_027267, partial [Pogonophryne albipinna]